MCLCVVAGHLTYPSPLSPDLMRVPPPGFSVRDAVIGTICILRTIFSDMPALELLELEGHLFCASPTSLVALADALWSASEVASHPPRLATLCLRRFHVQGVEGLAALGVALSSERFPRLSSLTLDSCRLNDVQAKALAAGLPGMNRSLTSLSLKSNYALSTDGVAALTEALKTTVDVQTEDASAAFASWKAIERTNGVGHLSCSTSAVDADRSDGRKSSAATCVDTAAATVSVKRSSATSRVTRAPAWSATASPTTSSATPSVDAAMVEAFPNASVKAAVQCSPVLLEVLDFSYSGCWRRPTIGDPGKPSAAPLMNLLKVRWCGIG